MDLMPLILIVFMFLMFGGLGAFNLGEFLGNLFKKKEELYYIKGELAEAQQEFDELILGDNWQTNAGVLNFWLNKWTNIFTPRGMISELSIIKQLWSDAYAQYVTALVEKPPVPSIYPIAVARAPYSFLAYNATEELNIKDFLGIYPPGEDLDTYLKGLDSQGLLKWESDWIHLWVAFRRDDLINFVKVKVVEYVIKEPPVIPPVIPPPPEPVETKLTGLGINLMPGATTFWATYSGIAVVGCSFRTHDNQLHDLPLNPSAGGYASFSTTQTDIKEWIIALWNGLPLPDGSNRITDTGWIHV